MSERAYIKGHEDHPHGHSTKTITALKEKVSLSEEDQEALKIVKALSDPTKLKIYLILNQVDEIAVSDLVYILGLSQSAISHALSDMKKLNLVDSHRCGQLICYTLSGEYKVDMYDKKLGFFGKLFKTKWYVEV